jgi:pimeloyl-ACP methyl ester carboxylesterase
MPGRRGAALAVAASAFALAGGGGAGAATPFAPCSSSTQVLCARVDVPLDRLGAVPGSISLVVHELPADGTPRGVMFLLAGGPGQSGIEAFSLDSASSAMLLRATYPGYALVTLDVRGTGKSGALQCAGFQRAIFLTADQEATLAAQCGAIIGPTRRFYGTRDQAEDIEAVRQALGLSQIAISGVSYGTQLALSYAELHPTTVERLILDSVAPPEGRDPFDGNVVRTLPVTLASYCAGSLCRGATANLPGEFAALANAIEAKPLRGSILIGGERRSVTMRGEDLIGLAIDADLTPAVEAELPAAVHAAKAGNPLLLLRLYYLDSAAQTVPADSISIGQFVSTLCTDGPFPWAAGTPVSGRDAAITSAIEALPAGTFGPFGSWAARLGTASLCRLWPDALGTTVPSGPLPNVPVLAVTGGLDLRTPRANAAAVVSRFPQGRLLVVPGVGHSVLAADFSFCAVRAVRLWLAGGVPPSSCPRVAPLVAPIPLVSSAPGTARLSRGATLTAARKVVREAEAASLFPLFGSSGSGSVPGLYGGSLVASGTSFRLVGYTDVPGLALDGTLQIVPGKGPPLRFKGTVSVSGPRATPLTFSIA